MATSRKKPQAKSIVQAYADAFATQSGKMVLEDLERAYQARQSFDENPYKTAFQEGQRSVYLRIVHLINSELMETNGTESND